VQKAHNKGLGAAGGKIALGLQQMPQKKVRHFTKPWTLCETLKLF
jgi:hypothetical protein